MVYQQIIRLNDHLAWDLSEEHTKKKETNRKMWTITTIALCGLAVYARLALRRHNKNAMNGKDE